jgi:hypothetical protein
MQQKLWISSVENFVEKVVGNSKTGVIHKQHPINTQVSQQDIFMI